MKTLVIIPAFNEAENIELLINEINDYGYEYLVINDCSNDDTPTILDKGYNHLDLSLNIGLANVTRVGFMYAYENDYDSVITIDGDGQHNPKYIEYLINELECGGYDYVVGSRFIKEKKDNSMRMIGSKLLCFFIRIKTGKKVTDPTSGMRAIGKNLLDDFKNGMNFIAEPDALTYVIHRGYKYKEVQVEMRERKGGTSYFKNPFKSAKFMFETLISILFIQW